MSNILYIATRDIIRFIPDPTEDEPGAIRYRGDMTTPNQIRLARSISFWPMGERRNQYLSGTLEVDNRSGAYDSLVNSDARDQPIKIKIVPEGPYFTEGQEVVLATAVSDTITGDEETIRVAITDPIARYEKPLVRDRSEDEETFTGKLTPVLFGVGRNIRAPLVEPEGDVFSGPVYRVSDGPLTNISVIRSRAFPLNGPDDSPTQWDFALGGAGFELNVNPQGPITCDASTTGESVLGEEPIDLMGGGGDLDQEFDGQSGGNIDGTTEDMPVGWHYRTRSSGIEPPDDWKVVSTLAGGERYLSIRTGGISVQASTGWIEIRFEDAASPAFRFEAGKTYRWRVERRGNLTGGFEFGGTIQDRGILEMVAGPPAASGSSPEGAYPSNRRLRRWRSFDPSAEPGVYSGTWTCPDSADGEALIFRFSGWAARVGFRGVRIFEVPDPTEDPLEGITLSDFTQEIVNRAGEPISSVNLDDLDGIQGASSPVPQIGYWVEDPITSLSLIRAPLDSYNADVYTDRAGITRFARLIDLAQSGIEEDFEVNNDNIIGSPQIEVDEANGLTSTATARPNWFVFRDSDFVDNFDDVPASMRQAFSEDGQFTVRAEVPDDFPPIYQHAKDAGPLFTVYDNAQDAQDALQEVIDFYSELRFFVRVDVALDFLPEPGDIVLFTWGRYGFSEGKMMRVIGVEDIVSGEASEITFRLRLHG